MEYINSKEINQTMPTAITLGNFDGIHLGHRELINITLNSAHKLKLKSVVFSFFSASNVFVRKQNKYRTYLQ